jgi:hypothetical protein
MARALPSNMVNPTLSQGVGRDNRSGAVYRIFHDGWDSKRALSEAKSYGISVFQRAMRHYWITCHPEVDERKVRF